MEKKEKILTHPQRRPHNLRYGPRPDGAGRKRKYATAEDFGDAVQEYADECNAAQKPFYTSGLMLHLGLSKQGYSKYRHMDSDYQEVCEYADLLAEYAQETGEFMAPHEVPIRRLQLASRFGRTEKQQFDHTTNGQDINTRATLTAEQFAELKEAIKSGADKV